MNNITSNTSKFPIAQIEQKSIVYTTLPGKPDASMPRPVGPDNRPRVTQKAAVGKQFCYYTINLLRERIGKNAPEALAEMRRIEMICSQYRKQLTKHMVEVPEVSQLILISSVAEFFKSIKKSNIAFLLPQLMTSISYLSSDAQNQIKNFLPKFAAQNKFDNLHDYFYEIRFNQKARYENEFLQKLGISAEQIYTREHLLYPEGNFSKSWNDLSVFYRNHFSSIYAFSAMAKAYGLKQAHWRPWPGTDINFLISELIDKGPMLVLGQYGNSHYTEDAILDRETLKDSEQKCEHKVYGWGLNAEHPKERVFCDPILVTGATVLHSGLGVVYFVDTMLAVTQEAGNRRIYAMTYEFFIANLSDTRGFDNNYEGFFPWGYHAPDKLNLTSS